jgi:hypothetical protein
LTGLPSGGGTYRVRTGTAGGTIVLANPGTTLGTGSELQITASTSTSTNKFGVYDWTSPSTVAYLKCGLRTTSSGSGNLNISIGANTVASDNNGYTSQYNVSLTSLTIAYTSGAISSVVRRNTGANTTITGSGLAKDTDQSIEIYASNSAGSEVYSRGGTNYTLDPQSWDLWVAGTKISPALGWPKANTWTSGSNIAGFAFFAESSASNAAVFYIDDLEYSNALPAPVASGTSVQFVSTSSSAAENSGTANLALAITNPSASNATTVTIGATGATGRISGYSTSVTFPANTSGNQNCVVTLNDDLLCNGNENVIFTITGISGGTPTATIGTNSAHTLMVQNDDVCTSVAFGGSNQTVGEDAGTASLTVTIANPSASQSTSVQVALLSGNGARVDNFATQTVTFPANSSADQTVTLTITDDILCNGNETLTFQLQNVTGGQGTPFIGTPGQRTVTVTDNETAADPTATAATGIGYGDFTANWNAVSGATGYWLDVSTYSDFLAPGETTVVEWNFPAATNDNVADGGIAANAAKTLTNVGASNVTYNSAGNGGLTARADTWTSGSGTKYWQVEFASTGYGDIKVSSKQRSSGTGPRDFKLQYRIGTGGTWIDVAGGAITVADDYATGVLSNLSLPAACADQSQVFLRWIMTSNTNVNNTTVAAAGASNIDDVVVSGRAYSFVSGYDNLSVGNATSQGVTGLAPLTSYYYRVRSAGGCSTGGNSNSINAITTAVPTYYSRATGNVTDPVWSPTPSGVAGAAVWTNGSAMVVQSGDVVTNTGNVTVKNVTVNNGGTLVLNNATTLKVTTGASSISGTLTANDGSTFSISEGTSATLAVSGTASFYDLTVAMATGATVTGGIDIRGTLLLQDGVFDCTGATVSLRSTAAYTGRLGPVAATASYTGNLKIERYIPAGATNWRLLGSPITNRTVLNWQDNFFTAGYPGSQYPGFSNPPGSGIPWPSIRWYDETNTGANQNDGLLGVSSSSQSLVPGQGFAAWCGDNLNTTNAFIIDLGASAPVVAQAPVTLPMSWTNTGVPTTDGWNLVANPLPSPIAFDQVARGADVADYVTFYNPANGNTAVYDISLGFGTNGATNIIQSMQGFFLKATGSAVTTTVSESAKVSSNSGGLFGGTQQSTAAALRLRIHSGINSFSDEAVVVFHEGTPDLDGDDARKYVFGDPNAPRLATVAGGESIAINAYGSMASGLSIPVRAQVGVSGTYTISLATVGEVGLTCITLEDLLTGTITALNDGGSYTFTINSTDDAEAARFVLHATAPLEFAKADILCGTETNGSATVTMPSGTADVVWVNMAGEQLLADIATGSSTVSGLAAGGYTVRVYSGSACGALVQDFAIDAPFVLEAQGTMSPATCSDAADGRVSLLVLGGTGAVEAVWSNGATGTDLVAAPGSYDVTLTDANGCQWTAGFIIGSNGPDASFTLDNSTVTAGTTVQFTSAASVGTHSWAFGDGGTSEESSPAYAWSFPGTYTVTHSVDNGACTEVESAEVTVELSTGVASRVGSEHRAWVDGSGIVVVPAFTASAPVGIDLLDATGRVAMQRRLALPGRVVLPADALGTGIWFVRMQQGGNQVTLRVPLVR